MGPLGSLATSHADGGPLDGTLAILGGSGFEVISRGYAKLTPFYLIATLARSMSSTKARIRQGLLRRLHVRGHDAEEGDIVFRFARDRPDVHGPVRKGLRHARQLPGFVGYEHLELLRSPPPSSSAEESAGPLQKASPPVRERQGTSRTRSRGNRIASRMFGRSRSFWTNRSSPNPQPPCGGMP